MKLLFVSHSSRLDGAGLALLELVTGLLGAGVAVEVVVPRAGPPAAPLRSLGAHVFVQPFQWWAGDRDRPRFARQFLALAHEAFNEQ